jgi:hypothetical protein
LGPEEKEAERMGKRKPPVFPEPVWAQAMRSRPPATMGMEYFWTGVGVVSGRVDVLDQDRVEGRAGELGDGLGDVSTGSLDGDRLVLVKVDSGVLEKRKNGG